MIYIEERIPDKVPGKTSIFVKFPYKQEIVDVVKTFNPAVYTKKTQEWEIPVSYTSRLIQELSEYDSITVKELKVEEKPTQEFELLNYKTASFKHQEEAIQYGLNHDKWLLLDAPGLGKTKSVICIAEELKHRKHIQHCLVICGINTLKSNWVKEIGIHSDLSAMILGQRLTKKGDIKFGGIKDRIADLKKKIDSFFVITNVETLRDEEVIKCINNGPNKFDMILFDECHKCKAPQAQQTKGLLKIKCGDYRIAMTGTMILNNPLDAYVPLKFIGADRSTYSNFRYYFCRYGGPFNNILLGFKNTEVLKNEIEECSLRRTKDLLDLPPKIIINEELDMSPEQQKLYENITSGIVDQVDKVNITTTSLLAMVGRLRQATACPTMLTTENIPSSKIDRACDLVDEITQSGNKVVIFSTFKETTKILSERLKEYNPVVCTGDDPDAEISKRIDAFQVDPSIKVMIATWQKMGTGVTLTAASYAIFIDTPWTAGVYEQAQDRIYRIGTKNTVFIYNLICKGTIDERVKEIVDTKRAISDYMIDGKIDESTYNNLRQYLEDLG